ncbi:MAG: molybdopterin molybdenumtransferase MoeA, partial [Deltaproteobacteria bacterium]|nr:molybdopterin molybdenumtransferase MoeA [Deltaproteobacteria bacterium]
TTGTELRDPGTPLEPGQIYESNGWMLEALLRGEAAEVTRLGIVADERDDHRALLERALEADVVVTSGGVSVGPHDLVREALHALGVEEIFWGIAMRPGKPLSFGRRGPKLVFGLPGNPVASLVGGLLLVAPAVRRLQGAESAAAVPLPARLAVEIRRNAARDDLLRGTLGRDGDALVFAPGDGQESHMIVRAASASAIGRIPRGDGVLAAGTVVDAYPLSRPGA